MGPLITKLCNLIVKSFDDEQFAMLMFEITQDFDYAGLHGSFKSKVFETVKWAYKYGDAPHVLWLAEIVAKQRPKREDAKKLVNEIKAKAFTDPAAAVPQDAGKPERTSLPQELASSLNLFEQRQFSMRDFVRDVRLKLRANS